MYALITGCYLPQPLSNFYYDFKLTSNRDKYVRETYGGVLLQDDKYGNIDPFLRELVAACMIHVPGERPGLDWLVDCVEKRIATLDASTSREENMRLYNMGEKLFAEPPPASNVLPPPVVGITPPQAPAPVPVQPTQVQVAPNPRIPGPVPPPQRANRGNLVQFINQAAARRGAAPLGQLPVVPPAPQADNANDTKADEIMRMLSAMNKKKPSSQAPKQSKSSDLIDLFADENDTSVGASGAHNSARNHPMDMFSGLAGLVDPNVAPPRAPKSSSSYSANEFAPGSNCSNFETARGETAPNRSIRLNVLNLQDGNTSPDSRTDFPMPEHHEFECPPPIEAFTGGNHNPVAYSPVVDVSMAPGLGSNKSTESITGSLSQFLDPVQGSLSSELPPSPYPRGSFYPRQRSSPNWDLGTKSIQQRRLKVDATMAEADLDWEFQMNSAGHLPLSGSKGRSSREGKSSGAGFIARGMAPPTRDRRPGLSRLSGYLEAHLDQVERETQAQRDGGRRTISTDIYNASPLGSHERAMKRADYDNTPYRIVCDPANARPPPPTLMPELLPMPLQVPGFIPDEATMGEATNPALGPQMSQTALLAERFGFLGVRSHGPDSHYDLRPVPRQQQQIPTAVPQAIPGILTEHQSHLQAVQQILYNQEQPNQTQGMQGYRNRYPIQRWEYHPYPNPPQEQQQQQQDENAMELDHEPQPGPLRIPNQDLIQVHVPLRMRDRVRNRVNKVRLDLRKAGRTIFGRRK
jgi:hypothetical protein